MKKTNPCEITSSLIMTEENYVNMPFPKDKTIHELFLDQVDKKPDHNALIYNNIAMTYKELNNRAEKAAKILVDKGLKGEDIVGVWLEPSFDLMIAILGILKAGGAYMVIDSNYPESRIEYMIQNCQVNYIIAQGSSKEHIKCRGTVLFIDEMDIENIKGLEGPVWTASDSLAYVLFTSGTTGNPKALMEEHRNVINVVYCLHAVLGADAVEDVLQFFSPSFTVSYQEMFTTLLFGGTYHIVDKSVRNNVGKLFEYIKEKRIKTVFFPTSFLKSIAKDKKYYQKLTGSLNHIVTAGEKLIITEEFLSHLEKENIILYNNYGISEVNMATIYPIPYHQTNLDNIPIGKPNFNTYIYVLDEKKNPLPIGTDGELYIAGDSVCRGYYNNEVMTAERFMTDPYHGSRMYKSGDIGRWDENGHLILQGRSDLQVNIKGYRVETGEIEYYLLRNQFIKECAVVAKNVDGENVLYAYIVTKKEITDYELKEYLALQIPAYMVPDFIIRLPEIPKLPASKIDRILLMNTSFESPKSNAEGKEGADMNNSAIGKLGLLVSDVIKEELHQNIDVHTNLQDVGINSLNFLRLVVSIEETFGIEFEDDNLDLSGFTTIKSLADYIESRGI